MKLENMKTKDRALILMAEDDPDDRLLIREALREAHFMNEARFVEDGEELLDYLFRRGKYKDPTNSPRPSLILLDLNMPRKDGREALEEIKSNMELKRIPVVVLTTSHDEEDINHTYMIGVSGYITKPVRQEELVNVMRTLGHYWFEMVELPPM